VNVLLLAVTQHAVEMLEHRAKKIRVEGKRREGRDPGIANDLDAQP
jgi:hypothetical protein